MIIVEGWVKLAAGELDKLRETALWMMEKTRKEEGCELYVYSTELENPDVMRISERWASPAALEAHGNSAHMAKFNEAMGKAQILGISVKAYTAEAGRTLIGGD